MFQGALALRQAYFFIKPEVVLSYCYKPASSSVHILLMLNLEIQLELHIVQGENDTEAFHLCFEMIKLKPVRMFRIHAGQSQCPQSCSMAVSHRL